MLSPRTTAIAAVVAGVIAIVAAVLTPFLPVTTTTATVTWPQGQTLGADNADITSPLVAQMAQDLDITIPCTLLRAAPTDASSTVLTTMPPAAKNQRASALNVTADANTVTVTMRGDTVASAPRADVASARCTELHIFSSAAGSGARFVGLGPVQMAPEADRPQGAGVITDVAASTITARRAC